MSCNTATRTTTHKVHSYGMYKSMFGDTEMNLQQISLPKYNFFTCGASVFLPISIQGFFDQKTAADMMKESEKMQGFEHPHVLNIIGVCVDAGPAPYIVMPFMANGSLLAYIKKEKMNLVVLQMMNWQVHINVTALVYSTTKFQLDGYVLIRLR